MTLETLYVEGMVHVSELGSDYFQFNETSHELRGERTGRRFRLTDEIDVQVARVNLEGRRIDFRLVADDAVRPRPAVPGVVADGAAAAMSGPRPPTGAPGAGGGRPDDRRTGERSRTGRKAASGKTPAVREAQAARKATARGRGFKKSGAGQAPRLRKKR